jgi:hypothetical protein
LALIGSISNAYLSWDLYTVERQDPDTGKMIMDMALAQGDAGVYVVLLAAVPDEYDDLHYAVFLRAVDALTPASVKGVKLIYFPGGRHEQPGALICGGAAKLACCDTR